MAITEARRIQLEALRREQILSVALGLFYRRGFKNTTVSDIAKEANISKGLIYRYFDSKADILFAYKKYLDDCFEELRSYPPKEAIREAAVRFLIEPDENGHFHPLRVYLVVFIKGELDDERFDDLNLASIGHDFYGEMFAKGIENGDFCAGDPYEYGDIFWHFLLGYVTDSVISPDSVEAERAIAHMNKILSFFEKES